MSHYLLVIILGIIQGITEFVPISSSGHLVILHNIFPGVITEKMAFDVFIHLGTLSAVFIFFFKDIKNIFFGWCASFSQRQWSEEARLGWLIILATIPAAAAGYFFDSYIEFFLRSNLVVVAMLVIVGIFFVFVEKFSEKQKKLDLDNLNWKKALVIGLAQAIALIPGTSRSGITIIAGMAAKLKRETAVRFSFLLSFPVILGASIKKIPPLLIDGGAIFQGDLLSFVLGFFMSFVFGFITIKWFLIFVEKHSLNVFAYYRFILAGIILFFWLI